jgi:septum formation protein
MSSPFSLILASTSAYRKTLLTRLGLPFTTEAPGVEEAPGLGETPQDTAERLAREKALAVAGRRPGAIVIGSDQVAVCAGRVMGKPGTPEKALEQLLFQAGQATIFHTALCLVRAVSSAPTESPQNLFVTTVTTTVYWRPAHQLTAERLARYVAIENPIDCAGAAKSEGLGLSLIASIDGDDPTALIGLPLIALTDGLIAWGLDPLAPSPLPGPASGQ